MQAMPLHQAMMVVCFLQQTPTSVILDVICQGKLRVFRSQSCSHQKK